MRKYLIVAATAATVTTAAASAQASAAHWCRQGDPPVYASARTSCSFAGTIITDYANVCRESRNCHMSVYSPTSRRRYRISCHRPGTRYSGRVYCKGGPHTSVSTQFSALI